MSEKMKKRRNLEKKTKKRQKWRSLAACFCFILYSMFLVSVIVFNPFVFNVTLKFQLVVTHSFFVNSIFLRTLFIACPVHGIRKISFRSTLPKIVSSFATNFQKGIKRNKYSGNFRSRPTTVSKWENWIGHLWTRKVKSE